VQVGEQRPNQRCLQRRVSCIQGAPLLDDLDAGRRGEQ
jgi:hypothetical protein